jgi:FkbM family methyltransferase
MSIKSTLKRLRSSQPLNRVTTSTLKLVFSLTNSEPEFVIKHLPRVGKTKVNLPDKKSFLIDSSGEDWIPTQLFWRGFRGYESEVSPIFYELAKTAEVVFDIGAHVGYFSLLAATANSQAQIYAFEPLQRVYERLERNVALNRFMNVHCVKAAVGDKEGEQEFYFPDVEAPVSSSLRSDLLLASLGDQVRHVKVSVVTLDDLALREHLGQVSLIKMDTERTEHEVLAGASKIIERDRPDIFCEVWPDADNIKQLEGLLLPLGYRFYHLLPRGPELRNAIEPSEEALNYLFSTKRLDEVSTTTR